MLINLRLAWRNIWRHPRRTGLTLAAIVFSDILVVTEAMGVPFEIVQGVGPVLERAIRTKEDVEQLAVPAVEDKLPFVLETIRLVCHELDSRIPLIGFAGAPFTLACYLVEGQPSKAFVRMRRLCHEQPEVAASLLDRIAKAVVAFLKAQIRAGVAAVQVFDSWAGVLSPRQYRTIAVPAVTSVLEALNEEGVPRILYVGHTGHYLDTLATMPADVISVDWRIPLSEAARRLPHRISLQGNLDPTALFLIERRWRRRWRVSCRSGGTVRKPHPSSNGSGLAASNVDHRGQTRRATALIGSSRSIPTG